MTLYLCMGLINYEGERIDGIYRTRAMALKHQWSYPDYDDLRIDKWLIGKNGKGRLVGRIAKGRILKERKVPCRECPRRWPKGGATCSGS
jgi:hypothetical protein